MNSPQQPGVFDRPADKDDEIVALSKALKDQVRDLKARVRAKGLESEDPSFAPDLRPAAVDEGP